MSRYAIDPPDEDRYEPKPIEDSDVPNPPIDPAEHAAHALIDALATLEKEIASNSELERAWVLKRLISRASDQFEGVRNHAMNKIDEILERRR